MPTCYLIGGPNGVGKSSFSREMASDIGCPRIDPDELMRTEFTNPDRIYFPHFIKGLGELYLEEG